MSLFKVRKYNIFFLKTDDLKPFLKTRGPITFDKISYSNLDGLATNFPAGKIDVFKRKLKNDCKGLFAKHNDDIVGYMWRKDYDSKRTIKADGYLPLKGRFSHIHFARVHKKMRGRALQLILMSKLIQDAKSIGFNNIYTDTDITNPIASRGIIKLGFNNICRLMVIRFDTGHSISIKYPVPKGNNLTIHGNFNYKNKNI